ncbi:MAG: ribonuclease H-like domain-containing protein [bacterium]
MSKFDFLDRFNEPQRLDPDHEALTDLAAQLNGEIINTDLGRYLQLICEYRTDFAHGDSQVGSLLAKYPAFRLECFEPRHQDEEIPLSEVIFVDAETTGLSAATGTVAFLLGVGFVRDNNFVVQQFFLPDYPDEPAQLEAIADLVSDYSVVCSFNGKSFDLPLLETRFVMQRQKSPFEGMLHIDLLHSSRRFWRQRLPDVTLQTLEKSLLGLYRYGDTPGYMIPQLYFDFLRAGRAEPLHGVFKHNQLDIVSLLFLLVATQRYLDQAEDYDYYSAAEALAISRFFLRQQKLEASCTAAARQFACCEQDESAEALGLHLSMLQKRLGLHDEALATFRRLAARPGEIRLFALEGAAKLLEHQFGEYDTASRTVVVAQEYLESPHAEIPYDRILFWHESLSRRRQRLLRKAAAQKNAGGSPNSNRRAV